MYVVDQGTVELCSNESAFGVNWPASSPGSPILSECPKRYEGQSQRICEQRDFGKPTWLTPNFSECIADSLVDVYNEVCQSNCITEPTQQTKCSYLFVQKTKKQNSFQNIRFLE